MKKTKILEEAIRRDLLMSNSWGGDDDDDEVHLLKHV